MQVPINSIKALRGSKLFVAMVSFILCINLLPGAAWAVETPQSAAVLEALEQATEQVESTGCVREDVQSDSETVASVAADQVLDMDVDRMSPAEDAHVETVASASEADQLSLIGDGSGQAVAAAETVSTEQAVPAATLEPMASNSATMEVGWKSYLKYYNDGNSASDSEMVLNGKTAWCLDFSQHTGWGQTYYSSSLSHDLALKWGLEKKYFFDHYDWQTAATFTQYIIWQDTGARNHGWVPCDTINGNNWDDAFWAAVAYYNANKDIYDASATEWDCWGYQSTASEFNVWRKTGNLHLTKSSSCTSVTEGNPNYSLEGTTYGVYTDAACTTQVYTFTVNADGTANELNGISTGTYYVKELTAGKGYLIDEEVHKVEVTSGKTTTFEAVDEPVADPNGVKVQKVTDEGQIYKGEDGKTVSLALAEYTYSYYTGYYESAEEAEASGEPAKTWTLRTNENGFTDTAHADATFTYNGETYSYLVSGDVFRFASGNPTMPFGTIVIQETKAPVGYQLSTEKFCASMRPADNEEGYIWVNGKNWRTGNVANAVEQKDLGSLTIVKTSADTSITDNNSKYTLEGAVFEIYDNEACSGDPLWTLITKADGTTDTITDLAPLSEFWIKEVKAPAGYENSNSTPQKVTIQAGKDGVTTFTCSDAPVYASTDVALNKVNSAGEQVFNGDATYAGAEYTFSFYAGKDAAEGTPDAIWVGTTDAKGYVNLKNATLTSGTGWTVDGQSVLPLGTLTIKETKAPLGYLLSDTTYTQTLAYNATTTSAEWTGDVTKYDNSIILAPEDQKLAGISVYKEIQGMPNETSPEGIQFEIIYKKTGEVVETLTLDKDGKATTGEKALPAGIYEVREVETSLPKDADGNYLIQPYSYTSGTNDNLIATVDLSDDGDFPLYKVIETGCIDYTTSTLAGSKLDADTDEPIADTEFTLYRYTGELGLTDGVIGTDASGLSAYGSYWEKVKTVTSDASGKFQFANESYGIYMLVESKPNGHYMSASESAAGGMEADPLQTARIIVIDKNHPTELQVWKDVAIAVECNVDKSTIAVTSAGLTYKTSSENGESKTNVGIEEYRYDVAFDNGNTNTYADEYWVIDELNMTASPLDLHVTKIYTPVVVNDTKAVMWLLIRTNKSADEVWVPTVETALHAHTLCDGSTRFDGTGWRLVGVYDSTQSTMIDVNTLGLDTDEYITGLCLYYGAVEQGFASTTPLSYMVKATHDLEAGTVIPNTATSHITRNYADTGDGSGPDGLTDDDSDSVTTTVISTFVQSWDKYLVNGESSSIGTWFPQTGDNTASVVPIVIIVALVALGAAFMARRQSSFKNKEDSHEE